MDETIWPILWRHPRKRGPSKAKCPKCGFELVLPSMSEEIECPKCGAHLARKNYEDDKLVTEPDEATLADIYAEEKWTRDHQDD
jgi:predicted nucleic-acid-binding Zn-ribbon protein